MAGESKKLYAEDDISKLAVLKSTDSIPRKYLMCVAAASVAEATTYPLDLTKTRLQLQGEIASGGANLQYRGMFKTTLGIISEEGFFSLWRGILPALYRHAIYTGFRMSAYEEIRNSLSKTDSQGHQTGFPLWKKVVAGMLAGGIGQFMASPTDLIKTQIQMEGKRRLMGKKPRVTGMSDAVRKILRQSGIPGLWRGCWPNVQRAALVNLGDLSTYDSVKRLILDNTRLKDNSTTHCLSSGCAGLVGAVMGTPADVIKARMMNQPTDGNGRGTLYRNSFDCLRQTVQGEGFLAVYKGFLPCWLRMAPWSLTFWLSYEQIRRSFGAKAW
ncbi:mitochondrial uncoupling protein 4 isoform X2 [Eurytemora carolleeae]|nr:mitochondrial uncoupling protein 4 isoform X2 [Eurytemora carolleeae]|eukprot:XP_023340141.1 mitochondrial uncoupling protein 4-like isoform X2 [Eurytemora affinis]